MRISARPVTELDIWNYLTSELVTVGSVGKLLADNLDGKISLAKADLSTLETRLSAARAGYLDNINNAELASVLALSAARLGYLDNLDNAELLNLPDISTLTAARIGYLDNIDSSIKALFYEHFAITIDDFPDVVVSGDAQNPSYLIDNSVVTTALYDTVDKYVEIDLKGLFYVKEYRHYGNAAHNEDGAYKITGWYDGVWNDLKTGIPTRLESWSSWISLTTPAVLFKLRLVATTIDTGASVNGAKEWEFKGVKIG